MDVRNVDVKSVLVPVEVKKKEESPAGLNKNILDLSPVVVLFIEMSW